MGRVGKSGEKAHEKRQGGARRVERRRGVGAVRTGRETEEQNEVSNDSTRWLAVNRHSKLPSVLPPHVTSPPSAFLLPSSHAPIERARRSMSRNAPIRQRKPPPIRVPHHCNPVPQRKLKDDAPAEGVGDIVVPEGEVALRASCGSVRPD